MWPAANESVACADDDPVPNQDEPSASKCNATDVWTSQCFGFEHEDQDYCSSASVDTWIVKKSAAGTVAADVCRKPSDPADGDSDAKCGPTIRQCDANTYAAGVKKSHDVPAAACALPGASRLRAARGRATNAAVPAADPVPALPGMSKSRAARSRASPAVADPVPAADRALPGASKSSAARGRDVDSPSSALPGANKSARGRSVPLAAAMASVPAESALPGAYKSRAARGRDVSSSVSAADCALPGEMKPRRGRTAKVPVPDCALPGVRKSSSARGRRNVPDVPDAPDDAPDVPDADAAAAADVLQDSGTELLSASHKLCAAHDCKVSVDTGNTSAQQPSTNGTSPLTDRKHKCASYASI